MEKVIGFKEVNAAAAGIDIGSEKVFVSVDGTEVEVFGTTTAEYKRCVTYLQQHTVKRVAMEATGVYWIGLYTMLESSGIKVSLVNPRQTMQKKGNKTDVRDCRWIQKLFAAGLLKESFVPEGILFEIRMLVREREDIIGMGGTYVNKMQRSLELMNIKLSNVISQIQGASGMRILKAILKGERDPQKLLLLCDERIRKNKGESVLESLEGNYNPTWLFMLEQNIELWEQHQAQVRKVDARIEVLLGQLLESKGVVEGVSVEKKSPFVTTSPR